MFIQRGNGEIVYSIFTCGCGESTCYCIGWLFVPVKIFIEMTFIVLLDSFSHGGRKILCKRQRNYTGDKRVDAYEIVRKYLMGLVCQLLKWLLVQAYAQRKQLPLRVLSLWLTEITTFIKRPRKHDNGDIMTAILSLKSTQWEEKCIFRNPKISW